LSGDGQHVVAAADSDQGGMRMQLQVAIAVSPVPRDV
jgi:hypothetical protein